MRGQLFVMLAAITNQSLIGVIAPVIFTHKGAVVDYLYGKVRGNIFEYPSFNITDKLKPAEAFYGLDYSSVSSGEFRFMPPKEASHKWDMNPDVSNVFGSPACPQRKMVTKSIRIFSPNGIVERYMRIKRFLNIKDEECLFLNLFRPARLGKLSLQYAQKYQGFICNISGYL